MRQRTLALCVLLALAAAAVGQEDVSDDDVSGMVHIDATTTTTAGGNAVCSCCPRSSVDNACLVDMPPVFNLTGERWGELGGCRGPPAGRPACWPAVVPATSGGQPAAWAGGSSIFHQAPVGGGVAQHGRDVSRLLADPGAGVEAGSTGAGVGGSDTGHPAGRDCLVTASTGR